MFFWMAGHPGQKALPHILGGLASAGEPAERLPVGEHLLDAGRLQGNDGDAALPEPGQQLRVGPADHRPDEEQIRGRGDEFLSVVGVAEPRPVRNRRRVVALADPDDLGRQAQFHEVFGVGRIEGDDPAEGPLEGDLRAVLVSYLVGLRGQGRQQEKEGGDQAEQQRGAAVSGRPDDRVGEAGAFPRRSMRVHICIAPVVCRAGNPGRPPPRR
jgi:hypothetical protein